MYIRRGQTLYIGGRLSRDTEGYSSRTRRSRGLRRGLHSVCRWEGGAGGDVRPRLSREYYRSTLKKADGLSLIVTSDLSMYILFEIVCVYVCVCGVRSLRRRRRC